MDEPVEPFHNSQHLQVQDLCRLHHAELPCGTRVSLPPSDWSEHMLGQMVNVQFLKLDTISGFWQELSPCSHSLMTLTSLFDRYCLCRLPFSIFSTLEFFQKIMSQALRSTEAHVCNMDNTFVYGCLKQQHDTRLQRAFFTLMKSVSRQMRSSSYPQTASSS